MQKKYQLLSAPSSVGRYDSTQVDEGRKYSTLLEKKTKAHVPYGSGEGGGGPKGGGGPAM